MSKFFLTILVLLNIYIVLTVNKDTRHDMIQSVKDAPHYVSVIADSISDRINND